MSDKCFCGHTEKEHHYKKLPEMGFGWYESWCNICDCSDYEEPIRRDSSTGRARD